MPRPVLTDNAIGCSVMMEAARILAAIGIKPEANDSCRALEWRRAGPSWLAGVHSRALWQLRRAEAGVCEARRLLQHRQWHWPRSRHDDLRSAGSGTILREATASFADLGFLGVTTTRSRQAASTDAFSFAAAGLPGVNALQDPIEYQSYTWHTNLDTYERVVEDDVKKSAIVIAAAVYHVAMRTICFHDSLPSRCRGVREHRRRSRPPHATSTR